MLKHCRIQCNKYDYDGGKVNNFVDPYFIFIYQNRKVWTRSFFAIPKMCLNGSIIFHLPTKFTFVPGALR